MGAEPADAERAQADSRAALPAASSIVGRSARRGMKLTINMPLMIYWQALGEASRSAARSGSTCRGSWIFSDTSGGPNVLKVRGAGDRRHAQPATAWPVTFDIDSGIKDLRHHAGRGQERGVELPLVERRSPALKKRPSARLGPRDGVGGRSACRRASETVNDPSPTTIIRNWSCHVHRSRSRKPAPSSTPPSRTAATRPIARRSPWRCSMPAGTRRVQARGRRHPALRHRLRQGLGRARHGLRLAHAAGRAAKTPQFFTMLAAVSGAYMVTNPGGVLIRAPTATSSARSASPATPRTRTTACHRRIESGRSRPIPAQENALDRAPFR